MRMTTRSMLLILLLGLLLLPVTYATAGVSLNQAVEQAKKRMGGRVISAETRNRDGHQVHNIRILTKDGKVRRLQINADGNNGKKGTRR